MAGKPTEEMGLSPSTTSSPASSALSEPPEIESEADERDDLSNMESSRPSIDMTNIHPHHDAAAPPAKRRRTGNGRAASSIAPEDNDDAISLSSDGFSSAPGSPTHDEYAVRDEAQTQCLWRDCDFGVAINNDELVRHVQNVHCATAGPKKVKYVCEWGECQRKTSNHPSGYALKAHMRSHTKEKPYYCALPECDKSFTRSDALAKHMRTVHEPEPLKPAETTSTGKKPLKIKLTNGSAASASTPPATKPGSFPPHADPSQFGPSHDEDGNPITPTRIMDNIQYVPAHHPITGQPGFMITYPPDVQFTAWESSIPADQLMRLLRRQLHWAEKDGEAVREECAKLEQMRKEEFRLKEILLDGVMESELQRTDAEGLLDGVEGSVREKMDEDAAPARARPWTGASTPQWRKRRRQRPVATAFDGADEREDEYDEDEEMQDADDDRATPTPSPPPTSHSAGGGFDGDQDPYDNYLAGRMAEYEERQRLRSLQNTPQKPPPSAEQQTAKETDAINTLMGMSGK